MGKKTQITDYSYVLLIFTSHVYHYSSVQHLAWKLLAETSRLSACPLPELSFCLLLSLVAPEIPVVGKFFCTPNKLTQKHTNVLGMLHM
jgi:hypothetical protein